MLLLFSNFDPAYLQFLQVYSELLWEVCSLFIVYDLVVLSDFEIKMNFSNHDIAEGKRHKIRILIDISPSSQMNTLWTVIEE